MAKERIPTAEEIRAARNRLGLLRPQFAALIGISACSVTRFEQGFQPSPTAAGKIRAFLDKHTPPSK